VSLRPDALTAPAAAPAAPPDSVDLLFRPDPGVWDGRFANNGWLQELPKPITKLTWDNALLLAPETARRLGVDTEDVVEVARGGRTLRVPVLVVPGQAGDTGTLYLGYGRRRAGQVGGDRGANAYLLRTADAPWLAGGALLRKTGERVRLATTHAHHSVAGRPLVRAAALPDYRQRPDFARQAVTSRPAPAAAPAWSPARPRTTSPSWGRSRSSAGARCTGCASTSTIGRKRRPARP
jgi:molybdopterin-containing oxidoreductase family iron-sulfur binding subunit